MSIVNAFWKKWFKDFDNYALDSFSAVNEYAKIQQRQATMELDGREYFSGPNGAALRAIGKRPLV